MTRSEIAEAGLCSQRTNFLGHQEAKTARSILNESLLMWALGLILLIWIFIALRACGVTQVQQGFVDLAALDPMEHTACTNYRLLRTEQD